MGEALKIEIYDDIYNPVYIPYLTLNTRTQIYYGGSSSGKSFFLAQRMIEDLTEGQRNYLVVRNVSNTLRTSTFNEAKKAISDYGFSDFFKVRESDMDITCKLNGRQAIFKGLDDEEKIKSVTPQNGVITDIWVEEATECKYEAIKQLGKRLRGRSKVPKRLTLSFNPIYQTHWIYKEYFIPAGWAQGQTQHQTPHVSILKTTYADNEFLEPDDIYELENEKNEYYRDVYTYGNWGILGDVVFTNWRTDDLTNLIPTFDNNKNGLDFGFTNDPTAFVRSHYNRKRKTIYIYKEMYKRGLTNSQIYKEIRGDVGHETVYADCAEPKSIKELNDLGLNVLACKKGKDSILHGIQWLQGMDIVIDTGCQNMINEATLYQWKQDKFGAPINTPEDRDNHLWDALRYAYESEHGGRVFSWA